MLVTDRRGMLGLAVAGITTGALAGGAGAAEVPGNLKVQHSGLDYNGALAKLRAYAEAELEAVGQPGMTLAIVDADGFAATLAIGWADIDAKAPVRPDHWFQIGSISKSVTGLCIHALVDEGKIDLDAPVSHYLDLASLPPEPITVQQLLNHSSGLPSNAPLFPDAPDRRLWTGFAPGAGFSYSNTGFDLLGHIIAQVTGRPHPEVIRERVLLPLGMTDAAAHIVLADRPRYAVGYMPLFEDRPVLLRPKIGPGPFKEGDFTSGAVSASGEAMLGYMRYMISLGRGSGGPLFSDGQAKALLARDVETDEFGPGSRYASGIATVTLDGQDTLHHTGGMVAFSSSFHADAATGVACMACVNGRIGSYRPSRTTAYAIRLMRAVREGRPLPDAPDPVAYRRVAEPRSWIGRWLGPDGRSIELVDDQRGLKLVANGVSARVEQRGPGLLVTDHETYGRHMLQMDRRRAEAGQIWWGFVLFGRDRVPVQPGPDAALVPNAGTYVDDLPWWRATILVRGTELHFEGMGGEGSRGLVKRSGGYWTMADDEGGLARFWFDQTIGGRCVALNASGATAMRLC